MAPSTHPPEGALPFHTSHTEVEADLLRQALGPGCERARGRVRANDPPGRFRDRIDRLVGVDLDESGGRTNESLDEFAVADLCGTLPFEDGDVRPRLLELRRRAPRAAAGRVRGVAPRAAPGRIGRRRHQQPLKPAHGSGPDPAAGRPDGDQGPRAGCRRSGRLPGPLPGQHAGRAHRASSDRAGFEPGPGRPRRHAPPLRGRAAVAPRRPSATSSACCRRAFARRSSPGTGATNLDD